MDEPAGQWNTPAQIANSGDACRNFHRMPPLEKASGNGAHSKSSTWTYSSFIRDFIAFLLSLALAREPVAVRYHHHRSAVSAPAQGDLSESAARVGGSEKLKTNFPGVLER
jgi:hypothetical protein